MPGEMSFLEHLDELRKRLIAGIIGIAVGCVVAFIFLDKYIFPFIMLPMQRMLPDGGKLITTEAVRGLHALDEGGRSRGPAHRDAVHPLPAVAVRRAGAVLARKEIRDPVRPVRRRSSSSSGAAFSHYVAFPVTWKFFIKFNPRLPAVHAEDRAGLRALREDAARLRRDLPDAGAGVLRWRAWGW